MPTQSVLRQRELFTKLDHYIDKVGGMKKGQKSDRKVKQFISEMEQGSIIRLLICVDKRISKKKSYGKNLRVDRSRLINSAKFFDFLADFVTNLSSGFKIKFVILAKCRRNCCGPRTPSASPVYCDQVACWAPAHRSDPRKSGCTGG